MSHTHTLHEWRLSLDYNGLKVPPVLKARCLKCKAEVAVRPEVVDFALAMEVALKRHDPEKGDSWRTREFQGLLDELCAKYRGMEDAYCANRWGDVTRDAVHAANFAMMIYTRIQDAKRRPGKQVPFFGGATV